MPIANSILSAAILAPLVAILATLSLTTLQKSIDWIAFIAKTPQKGFLKQIKPHVKHVDTFLERLLGGNKFTATATNVLLMATIILLIALLLEGSEKPKKVTVVEKKQRTD